MRALRIRYFSKHIRVHSLLFAYLFLQTSTLGKLETLGKAVLEADPI
jgi:hypothetical protein